MHVSTPQIPWIRTKGKEHSHLEHSDFSHCDLLDHLIVLTFEELFDGHDLSGLFVFTFDDHAVAALPHQAHVLILLHALKHNGIGLVGTHDDYDMEMISVLTHWPLGNLNEILNVIFKQILVIDDWGISCEIALLWMSLDFADDLSTLVQVMAWCRQATSHYLSQCWPRSMSPNGITRPQWVNY